MARLTDQKIDPEYGMRVFGDQPTEPILSALRGEARPNKLTLMRRLFRRPG